MGKNLLLNKYTVKKKKKMNSTAQSALHQDITSWQTWIQCIACLRWRFPCSSGVTDSVRNVCCELSGSGCPPGFRGSWILFCARAVCRSERKRYYAVTWLILDTEMTWTCYPWAHLWNKKAVHPFVSATCQSARVPVCPSLTTLIRQFSTQTIVGPVKYYETTYIGSWYSPNVGCSLSILTKNVYQDPMCKLCI